MIRMPCASLGTERDDRRRLERIDDRCESRAQLAQHFKGCETTVRKTKDVKLSHAEPVGGAGGLLGACGCELWSSGNVGEIANAFGAVRSDHEMRLATLSRESGQQRTDDSLVIGVSEDGDDRTAGLARRGRERDDHSQ